MIGCSIGLTRGGGGGGVGAAAWSPALLSGKLLWLRGDVGVQLSAGKVVQWNDQSGLGNHVSALGAGSTQPIQATWAAGLNAPACYFDGNDRLATVGNILPTADGSGVTTFFIGDFIDTAARCPYISSGTSGGFGLSQNAGGDLKIERWKVGVAFDSDGPARTSPLNVVMVDTVGAVAASTMHVNGALVATTTPGGAILTPTGRAFVGAAGALFYHKGIIGELLVLNGRASPATIAFWNAYTLNRYGV